MEAVGSSARTKRTPAEKDALAVAAEAPGSRFAIAVAALTLPGLQPAAP